MVMGFCSNLASSGELTPSSLLHMTTLTTDRSLQAKNLFLTALKNPKKYCQ